MKKPSKPFIVKLAIMTTITIVMWVGFDVYRSFTQKQAPEVPAQILAPIDPTLDKEVLDKLKEKVYLEEVPL